MKGYLADVEHLPEENSNFRKVLYTGKHLQLLLMTLKPGESIGSETHATHDQFFRIEQGTSVLVIDGATHACKDGDGIIVPAGAVHNLTNAGIFPGPVCMRGGAQRGTLLASEPDFWEATPRIIHPRTLE